MAERFFLKYAILLLLSLKLFGESSFISPMEYASQLYKNPRGIGCQNCHGERGEGKLVATYKHKGEEKEFRGPSIKDSSFKEFYKALSKRNRGMPRYYLTRKEIQALHLYINKKSKNAEK